MPWAAAKPSPHKPLPRSRNKEAIVRKCTKKTVRIFEAAPSAASAELHKTMEKLTGIHAVREALAAGRPLQTVIVGRGRHGDRLDEIVRLAKSAGVSVRFEDRMQLDRAAGTRGHQGVVALVAAP